MRSSWLGLLALLTLLPGRVALAQQEAEDLRRVVAQQNELIQRLLGRIEQVEAQLAELEERLEPPDSEPETARVVGESAASLAAEARDAEEAPTPEFNEEDRREQERLVRAAFQRTLIDRGGMLLPPGTIDFQPSMSYLQSASENIVIDGFTILPVLVVGDIVSERVERSLYQLASTFRFGLPWDSQLEVRLPYSYHSLRSFSADGTETETSTSGLADIDIGFSRQLFHSQSFWPDLLASLRWKTTSGTSPFDIDAETALPTGTGYDSLGLSFTAVKVVDPLVYFASLNYSKNRSSSELIGRFDPGDSLGFSLGMAIALNLNSSLSFSYDQQSTRRTHIDGVAVPGSYLTTGVFTVGTSFAISDSLATDLSLGIGVTEDSPDVQLSVSFPIRWRR